MATNALDGTIQSFCRENPDIFGEDEAIKEGLAKRLSKELRNSFLQTFGAPVTGRVSDFIPFLPFTNGEQAVVVHKLLLELTQKVREPINLSHGPEEQLLGGVKLQIRRDASVCCVLANTEYSPELGARSLSAAAKIVEDMIVESYLDESEEIAECKEMREFIVDVSGKDVMVTKVQAKRPQRTIHEK